MSKSEPDKVNDDWVENFSYSNGWRSARSSEAPNRLESQIRVASDLLALEVRRRPSSWDDSDDELPSPLSSTISPKSKTYSPDSNTRQELIISGLNKIKKESFPPFEQEKFEKSMENLICQIENLEDESGLKPKQNQINRRQSPARIRRRTKSSGNSSPVLELKSQVNSSPEEEPKCHNQNQEMNEYYLDYANKLESREFDLKSKVFLDSIFAELRTQRADPINIENCALVKDKSPNTIKKEEETDSQFLSYLEKSEVILENNESDLTFMRNIFEDDNTYYCRTSRKLSKILEVEEIKKDSDDKLREEISGTIENKTKKLFLSPMSSKNDDSDDENYISSNDIQQTPTARNKHANFMLKDFCQKFFCNSNSAESNEVTNIEKNSIESISEKCHRLFKPEDNDDIIFLTPKSAQTEIGFDQESTRFGTETLTRFLQDYSISRPWIENVLKENKGQDFNESLMSDLRSPTLKEQSPNKNINDSFKSNEEKTGNIIYSNLSNVNENPKLKISRNEDFSEILKVDIQNAVSDVNYHENLDEEKLEEKKVFLTEESSAAINSESLFNKDVANIKTEAKLKKKVPTNLKDKETKTDSSLSESSAEISFRSEESFEKNEIAFKISCESPKTPETKNIMYDLPRNESINSFKALKNALNSSHEEFNVHFASQAKILKLNATDNCDSTESAKSLESYKSFRSLKSSSSSRQDDQSRPIYMVNASNSSQNSKPCYPLSLESPKFPTIHVGFQSSKKLIPINKEKRGTTYGQRRSAKIHGARKENKKSSQPRKDQEFIASSKLKGLAQSKVNFKEDNKLNNPVRLEKTLDLKQNQIVTEKLTPSSSRSGTSQAELRNYPTIGKSPDKFNHSNFRENKNKVVPNNFLLKTSKSTEMIKTSFECEQDERKTYRTSEFPTSNWASVQESQSGSSKVFHSKILRNKVLEELQDDKSARRPEFLSENLLNSAIIDSSSDASKWNEKVEDNADEIEILQLMFKRESSDISKTSGRKNSVFKADEQILEKETAISSPRSRSSTRKSSQRKLFVINEKSFQSLNQNNDDIETEVFKAKCRASLKNFRDTNSSEELDSCTGFDIEKISKLDKSLRSKMSWLKNKESNESKTKNSFHSNLSEEREWKNEKRINTFLEDELWNDLIESFDDSDGSGKSLSYKKNKFPGFPQKNTEESGNSDGASPTRYNYSPIFISEDDEEEDQKDGSLTFSREIIEDTKKPNSPNEKENESSPTRQIHHNSKSVVVRNSGKQTSKTGNPNFHRNPKMFYLDIDETDNLKIGEFGDVTYCNVGEFNIMQEDKPNNFGDGDQKQIASWNKFSLITEGTEKDKESKIQRHLWTEVKSNNPKNVNIMKGESLIQEGEGNMNLKKYIKSHDVNKTQNQNSTNAATKQDESIIIKKSTLVNHDKGLEPTSNIGDNNKKSIMQKSTSKNMISKNSSSESLKSSSTDTYSPLKKCERVSDSFRNKNNLLELNDFEVLDLRESCHFFTDETFEKKNIKEVKESGNLNIFLAHKTKDTFEVKPNNWLVVKNSRDKGGKLSKSRRKQKTAVKKKISKDLCRNTERRLLGNRTTTSMTLLKLDNTNCFQNFYKRLISIFCATSISTAATLK